MFAFRDNGFNNTCIESVSLEMTARLMYILVPQTARHRVAVKISQSQSGEQSGALILKLRLYTRIRDEGMRYYTPSIVARLAVGPYLQRLYIGEHSFIYMKSLNKCNYISKLVTIRIDS